jgi:hypothetical protein
MNTQAEASLSRRPVAMVFTGLPSYPACASTGNGNLSKSVFGS